MPPNKAFKGSHVNFNGTVDILNAGGIVHAALPPPDTRSLPQTLPKTVSQPLKAPQQATGLKSAAPSGSQPLQQQKQQKSDDAKAYWDWAYESQGKKAERERILKDILEKDRIRQILSTKHIEEHLIRTHFDVLSPGDVDDGGSDNNAPQSAKAASASQEQLQQQADSYWEWPTPPLGVNEAPKEETYWYMPPTEPKVAGQEEEKLLQQILKQEQCRQVLSADHVVSNLEAASGGFKDPGAGHAVPAASGSESYWDW
uniref:Uncharacterized protein n=1 Tax=Craspedostauros australis TaxID=1486917 RepID=A0A7R9WSJ5_9STRA|mmetsp:Transcript_16250/g.45048  ORF Transcript_16250/g.45048 Transcript_16250/m.45048 type:complete len:257 (+) Transcript_16250:173-943(+)|eukprot:CAMPEP_0198115642 /NCGR_PEP_ID=MMETSP1442-20131203/6673_1 /TAXON_ID= /ORGANISM="Craspedostauros australis, Strain CCMP3328" /LENGTH=256 /DNA_ID=CAMNT_0043773187 /DNA_START=175 /DNA_END=945 /DNA_ORIENTATION=+